MIDFEKWHVILFYIAWLEVSGVVMLTGLFVTLHTQSYDFDIPPGNVIMIVGYALMVLGFIGIIGYLNPESMVGWEGQ